MSSIKNILYTTHYALLLVLIPSEGIIDPSNVLDSPTA